VPPGFLQAVARVFTFLCENRGDTGQDPNLLYRCGAMTFLGPGLTYIM